MYKGSSVRTVSKDIIAGEQNDLYISFVKNELKQEIGKRLSDIIDHEKEIIVRCHDIREEENLPIMGMEYRRDFEWMPLVRCKDCEFREGSSCQYSAVYIHLNGFCHWGRKSDEQKGLEQKVKE